MTTIRYFRPTYETKVAYWFWTDADGLRVMWRHGMHYPSVFPSVDTLLAALRDKHGRSSLKEYAASDTATSRREWHEELTKP